jgi:hypothetical protein
MMKIFITDISVAEACPKTKSHDNMSNYSHNMFTKTLPSKDMKGTHTDTQNDGRGLWNKPLMRCTYVP